GRQDLTRWRSRRSCWASCGERIRIIRSGGHLSVLPGEPQQARHNRIRNAVDTTPDGPPSSGVVSSSPDLRQPPCNKGSALAIFRSDSHGPGVRQVSGGATYTCRGASIGGDPSYLAVR